MTPPQTSSSSTLALPVAGIPMPSRTLLSQHPGRSDLCFSIRPTLLGLQHHLLLLLRCSQQVQTIVVGDQLATLQPRLRRCHAWLQAMRWMTTTTTTRRSPDTPSVMADDLRRLSTWTQTWLRGSRTHFVLRS
ncbi:hypothetical protein EJB05_12405 [Eragrostis curvula]|uniref:Uncharacterized protein n=1 Tax=Eragrostis curvula TaxID=38414 RepID=A0A5J9VUC5_9POAL|nr:hypothetical protein EJB05_12405 [Eragrostis curvula]